MSGTTCCCQAKLLALSCREDKLLSTALSSKQSSMLVFRASLKSCGIFHAIAIQIVDLAGPDTVGHQANLAHRCPNSHRNCWLLHFGDVDHRRTDKCPGYPSAGFHTVGSEETVTVAPVLLRSLVILGCEPSIVEMPQ